MILYNQKLKKDENSLNIIYDGYAAPLVFQCPEIKIKIHNIKISASVDTISKISCVSKAFLQKKYHYLNLAQQCHYTVIGFDGKNRVS